MFSPSSWCAFLRFGSTVTLLPLNEETVRREGLGDESDGAVIGAIAVGRMFSGRWQGRRDRQ
jgi:hypothetical protein